MSKFKLAGIVLALVALLGGGALLAQMSSSDKSTDSSNSTGTSTDTSKDTSDTSASEATATDRVEIKDFAYSPTNITVKVGTKVTWTNQDSVAHTVTSDDDSTDGGLDSKLLEKGESYSATFSKAGTFTYHCAPHPQMTGTVTVTE